MNIRQQRLANNHILRRVCKILSVLVVTLVVIIGCAQIRLVTYPDSFVWIDGATVRSAMHTMAGSLGAIEKLIENETSTGEHKEQILNELNTLDATAQKLAAGSSLVEGNDVDSSATNHLLIDDHLEEFAESILLARLQIHATPPNYYRAGTLVGSCTACHRFR